MVTPTKKLKIRSQSEAVKEKVEKVDPGSVKLKEELTPVVTKAVKDAVTELAEKDTFDMSTDVIFKAESEVGEIKAGDEYFQFVSSSDSDGETRTVNALYKDPKVTICGKVIELKKEEKSPTGIISYYSDYYGKHANRNLIQLSNHGRYNQHELPEDFKIQWWSANVNGVKVWLTQGSYLMVTENLCSDDWGYDGDDSGSVANEKKELVLIASGVNCKHLSVIGRTILNNSSIKAENYVDLKRSTVVSTSITVGCNININSSMINSFRSYGGEYLTLSHCKLRNISLPQYGRVHLKEVNTMNQRESGFSLNIYGAGNSESLTLDIRNIDLPDFNVTLGNGNDTFTAYMADKDNNSQSIPLVIENRVDFGFFSGLTPIGFIRLGSNDILVGDQVFTAKEFFGKADQKTQPEPVDPTRATLRDTPPYYNTNFGVGILGTGDYYKGSLVWNRAAKALFGYKHRNMVIGKSGEAMVNTLIEQIKSRLGLYVEIQNMGL
ncbi:hypothetical protein D5W64_12695 [Salmonella enterica subsp. enterica serovar Saintpaul]|nr:hypothetical protein [Salmonella enterica subsp. enterica serovar Saintpaul]